MAMEAISEAQSIVMGFFFSSKLVDGPKAERSTKFESTSC